MTVAETAKNGDGELFPTIPAVSIEKLQAVARATPLIAGAGLARSHAVGAARHSRAIGSHLDLMGTTPRPPKSRRDGHNEKRPILEQVCAFATTVGTGRPAPAR